MFKRSKEILVDIRSAVIQVAGSLYPVNQIAGVKRVYVRKTVWEWITFSRKHAILVKTTGDGYFVLVGSRDEKKVDEVFSKIRNAIDAQAQGNFTYVGEVSMTGDVINQSGNFGVGFNKGTVDLAKSD